MGWVQPAFSLSLVQFALILQCPSHLTFVQQDPMILIKPLMVFKRHPSFRKTSWIQHCGLKLVFQPQLVLMMILDYSAILRLVPLLGLIPIE